MREQKKASQKQRIFNLEKTLFDLVVLVNQLKMNQTRLIEALTKAQGDDDDVVNKEVE